MAIETSIIDTGDNAASVTSWLQANATDYLTNIVNTEGTITADIIGGGTLSFTPGTRYCGTLTAKSGYSRSLDFGGSDAPKNITSAFKTSKGIVLNTVQNPTFIPWTLTIGKTNNGTIYAIETRPMGSSSGMAVNNLGIPYVIDFTESNSEYRNVNAGKPLYSSLTSIAAMPINDTYNYGDGLYFVACTDIGRFGIVEFNTKHYVALGCFWLEE